VGGPGRSPQRQGFAGREAGLVQCGALYLPSSDSMTRTWGWPGVWAHRWSLALRNHKVTKRFSMGSPTACSNLMGCSALLQLAQGAPPPLPGVGRSGWVEPGSEPARGRKSQLPAACVTSLMYTGIDTSVAWDQLLIHEAQRGCRVAQGCTASIELGFLTPLAYTWPILEVGPVRDATRL
jgi:hypothetical protein